MDAGNSTFSDKVPSPDAHEFDVADCDHEHLLFTVTDDNDLSHESSNDPPEDPLAIDDGHLIISPSSFVDPNPLEIIDVDSVELRQFESDSDLTALDENPFSDVPSVGGVDDDATFDGCAKIDSAHLNTVDDLLQFESDTDLNGRNGMPLPDLPAEGMVAINGNNNFEPCVKSDRVEDGIRSDGSDSGLGLEPTNCNLESPAKIGEHFFRLVHNNEW